MKRMLTDLGETGGRQRARAVVPRRGSWLPIAHEDRGAGPVSDHPEDHGRSGRARRGEHRTSAGGRDGLAKLEELVSAPGFGAAVEMLLGGISHHVEEEESEILPTMKSELSREQWMVLGDQIAGHEDSPLVPAPSRAGKKTARRSRARSVRPSQRRPRRAAAKAAKRPTTRSATGGEAATRPTSASRSG